VFNALAAVEYDNSCVIFDISRSESFEKIIKIIKKNKFKFLKNACGSLYYYCSLLEFPFYA